MICPKIESLLKCHYARLCFICMYICVCTHTHTYEGFPRGIVCTHTHTPTYTHTHTHIYIYTHMHLFFYWLYMVFGILVLEPGIQPAPPELEGQSLSH